MLAKNKLYVLILLFCISLNSNAQNISALQKKSEIKKLKLDNYPKSEFYIGVNLNSDFGTIESTENSLNLKSVSMKFDHFLPSFKIGYKYLLNPEKHHGLFAHINHFSKRSITFSNNEKFVPAFDSSFNEIQIGLVYGRLQLGYGVILEENKININTIKNKTYKLNSIGANYTLFRSNNLRNPRTISDYWAVNTGLNYFTDFKDLNYTSFTIGLNYNFTFNRSLDLKDKIWLQKRTFE